MLDREGGQGSFGVCERWVGCSLNIIITLLLRVYMDIYIYILHCLMLMDAGQWQGKDVKVMTR